MEDSCEYIKTIKDGDDVCYLLISSVLEENASIRVTEGTFKIKLLHGNVLLNGYELLTGDNLLVSVGITDHFLVIKPKAGDPSVRKKKHLKCSLAQHVSSDKVNPFLDELKTFPSYPDVVILICTKWRHEKIHWMESIILNPRKMYGKMRGQSDFLKIQYKMYGENAISENWIKILEDKLFPYINGSSIILVSGGVRSGKSILIQYLINRLMSNRRQDIKDSTSGTDGVIFMDCDAGQSQLSPPGLLTATFIPYFGSEPLLSSPFINSLQFDEGHVICSTSVGATSPAHDPEMYAMGLHSLWQKVVAAQAGKRPVFLNTMGWLNGIGAHVLTDTFRITNANIVIQIKPKSHLESDDRRRLFSDFTSGVGWSTSQSLTRSNHRTIILDQNTRVKERNTSKINRTLQQLAYFSKMDGIFHKPLHEWHSVTVDLKKVFFHVSYKTMRFPFHVVLDSFDYSWVHLLNVPGVAVPQDTPEGNCHVLQSVPQNQCLGSGIVILDRMAEAKDRVRLITPVSPELILNVNCLLRPDGIKVPQTLLTDARISLLKNSTFNHRQEQNLIHDSEMVYLTPDEQEFLNSNQMSGRKF